jgi:hypothetical protein
MSAPNDGPKVELPDLDFMFRDAAQIARPGPTSKPATPEETPIAENAGNKAAESDPSPSVDADNG